MTDTATTGWRHRLLMRAAIAPDCTALERDRIIRHMFPGLDHDTALKRLREAWQAHQAKNLLRAKQIIDELIEQNQRGRP